MARRDGAARLMEAWPADLPWLPWPSARLAEAAVGSVGLRASPTRTRASGGDLSISFL
jgi:hypothetical protein